MLVLYYKIALLTYKLLENYFKIADNFKNLNQGSCSASQAIIHLHWFKKAHNQIFLISIATI